MATETTLTQAQEEIVEEFSMMSDWQDRYEHLIELGKELPLIAPEKKTEQNIVRGCQSRVWLDAELVSGRAEPRSYSTTTFPPASQRVPSVRCT